MDHNIKLVHDTNFSLDFIKVELNGDVFFVPQYAKHRAACDCILNGSMYEPLTHVFVQKYCAIHTGSIIHAGTFYGDMLPNFSKYVRGTVYAFEPVLENYILAKLCVEANNLTNVHLQNAALSNIFSILHINTNQGGGLHAGGGSKISNTGSICSSVTIDSLDAKDIVLIQLDVEGHELEALRGAAKTIEISRPIVAIEDNENSCVDFLLMRSYLLYATIPGLNIWIPRENKNAQEQLMEILA